MVETIKLIGSISSVILSISGCLALFIKPIRDRLFNSEAKKEGDLALIRDRITEIYYNNIDNQSLREYEFENLTKLYQAYKSRGGNSFIDKIYAIMMTWRISDR